MRKLSIETKLKVCAKSVLSAVDRKRPKEVEVMVKILKVHLASEDANGLVMNVGLDKLVKRAVSVGTEYACGNGYFKCF